MSSTTPPDELKDRIETDYAREELSIEIGELDKSGQGTVPQQHC